MNASRNLRALMAETEVANVDATNSKFPTVEFKSLLQNSDLLEILLKPLKNSDDAQPSTSSTSWSPTSPTSSSTSTLNSPNVASTSTSSINNFETSGGGSGADLNTQLDVLSSLPGLTDASFTTSNGKSTPDFESDEYLELKIQKLLAGDIDNANNVCQAYIGPKLWDKNDLFQSGGVEFEHLEIDEFLSENGLNEKDVAFLDQIQKMDSLPSIAHDSPVYPSINKEVQKPAPISTSITSSISPSTSLMASTSSFSATPSSSIPSVVTVVESSHANPHAHPLHPHAHVHPHSHTYPVIQPESAKKLNSAFEERSPSYHHIHRSSTDSVAVKSVGSSSSSQKPDSPSVLSVSSEDIDPRMRKLSDDDLKPQPILRKSKKQFVPNELKDDKYWSRRRKNNIAAKRSRDARRMKENQIAIRASYLESEYDAMRKKLEEFKRENKVLKAKLAKYEALHPELLH